MVQFATTSLSGSRVCADASTIGEKDEGHHFYCNTVSHPDNLRFRMMQRIVYATDWLGEAVMTEVDSKMWTGS